MFKKVKSKYYGSGAAITVGMMSAAESAHANSFSTIAQNITTQIQNIPGLLTALAYMFGLLLAVLGLMKIKDHVENPTQTPLKDGAIRLAIGGALFAIPIVSEAMRNLLNDGGTGQAAVSATVNKIQFNVT